uniref:DUF3077 domain-containing protein n=1 Tax=Ascaris lumbricoides TaxID=6252 RepID=A0A0M3IT02_ASCLU
MTRLVPINIILLSQSEQCPSTSFSDAFDVVRGHDGGLEASDYASQRMIGLARILLSEVLQVVDADLSKLF